MAYHEAKVKREPKAAMTIEHVEIRRAKNGGHTVEHHRRDDGPGPFVRPAIHVFGKDEGDDLIDHLVKHLGITAHGRKDEDDGEEKEAEGNEE